MARRRLLRAVGPALLLAVGGAYAIASFNWCGRRPPSSPTLTAKHTGEGALRAGAARVAMKVPYPVTMAGFGLKRTEARGAALPLHVRAIVLEQGGVRLGLVSLEQLLVPGSLTAALSQRVAPLQLDDLVLTATHSHTSYGGYDDRLIFQLAGTGWENDAVREALLDAAARALEQASAALVPATVAHATGSAAPLVISRVGDMPPDAALTRLQLRAESAPIAEVVIVSAHPTFRSAELLTPDYPGWFSAQAEANGGPVTLVMMGAVGNGQAAGPAADAFAASLFEAAGKIPPAPAPSTLRYAEARVALPGPDSSRLVPKVVQRAGDNFLCASSPKEAELSLLEIGGLRLLFAPGELTFEAADAVKRAAGADRVVSLAGDYLGYVEAPARVEQGTGESRRQYFVPSLAEVFAGGAGAAAAALETK